MQCSHTPELDLEFPLDLSTCTSRCSLAFSISCSRSFSNKSLIGILSVFSLGFWVLFWNTSSSLDMLIIWAFKLDCSDLVFSSSLSSLKFSWLSKSLSSVSLDKRLCFSASWSFWISCLR